MTIFPVDRQFPTQFWQSPPQTFWVPTNLILLSGFCQSAIKVEWKQFIAKGHISLKVGQDWVVQIAPKTHSVHRKKVMALLGNMWKHNSHVLGKIIGWDEPWVQFLFFGSFWALGPFNTRKSKRPSASKSRNVHHTVRDSQTCTANKCKDHSIFIGDQCHVWILEHWEKIVNKRRNSKRLRCAKSHITPGIFKMIGAYSTVNRMTQ